MDKNDALIAFAALGQPTRIDAFRLLVRAGPEGMLAGEIAEALGVRQNTMSANLAVLLHAGLVTNRREGRAIRYGANLDGVQGLLSFLVEDCCGGQPGLCRPILENLPASRGKAMIQPKNVLFLCTGNSARSLMAEEILNREGAGSFRAFSAGSDPAPAVHPYTLDLLRGLGRDVSHLRAKSWDEFAAPGAPRMDFVFTVCDKAAAEPCPVWPGQPMTAHWGVPDPVVATGNEAQKRLAFSDSYRMLRNRITAFISLPMETLDRMALKVRLDEIGRIDAAEPAAE